MFKINGIHWKIYYTNPDDINLMKPDGTYALGCCDNATQIIYVNKMLDKQKLWDVICHEIVHAVMFSYNIFLTEDEEERLANIITLYAEEILAITNILFNRKKGVS